MPDTKAAELTLDIHHLVKTAREAASGAERRLTAGAAETARACPVRVEFLRRVDNAAPIPPTVLMLRGGRGGEVRLKLYLSLLWLSVKAPHETEYPAYTWARLLGLSNPDEDGKRRVQDAISWLVEHEFVAKRHRAGKPPVLRVLHDSGSGESYHSPVVPGSTGEPTYRKVSPEFWTSGWIAVLSAASLIVWLAFVDEQGSGDGPQWLAPSVTRSRYALSPDTRKKGLAQLVKLGLLTPTRQWLRPDFERHRAVIKYRLNATQLQHDPLEIMGMTCE